MSKAAGFTIVDMLVSLAIIALISSIMMFNLGSERQTSALNRGAQKLSLDLRRAQNFALSAKNFKTSGVPCSWGIHFLGVNSSNYVIFADVSCDGLRDIGGSEDFETVNFESGIKINSLSGGLTDILFTPPDPVVAFSPDQTSAVIVLINKNLSTRTVSVNKVGLISFQ